MLLCNYETDYFMESIVEASGRRYNIPSPGSEEKPLVGRNISEDDVAGFFRTLKIGEDHMDIVRLINYYLLLEFDAIASYLGHRYKDCKNIIDECVFYGLIYENYIKLENGSYFYWYMVDAGGVYALNDRGIEYNKLPYTSTLEQKYKQYLKSQFLIKNYEKYAYQKDTVTATKTTESWNVIHLEDVIMSDSKDYKNTIFLVNLEILKELKINKLIHQLAQKINRGNNKFYDMSGKGWLKIGG